MGAPVIPMRRLRLRAISSRDVRLVSGLLLFAYATAHFVNHALGIFVLDTMEAASTVLLAPWNTIAGRALLYAALVAHAALGLSALFAKRFAALGPGEAVQLGLGLAIPFLLLPHVVNARLGDLVWGLEDTYGRLLLEYFLVAPGTELTRQIALLLAVWLHGCIGIHMWLRRFWTYQRLLPAAVGAALLIPTLALVGIANAGWYLEDEIAGARMHLLDASPRTAQGLADVGVALGRITWIALLVWALAVLAVVLARVLRGALARGGGVRIAYPGGRVALVPRGVSVLEASRMLGLPHASVCGGRGRCSTCRVRVLEGLDACPPPDSIETRMLQRIAAPPGVRLACRLRPTGPVVVVPLVRAQPGPAAALAAVREDGGREATVTALFVDLRNSTGLTVGRPAYDALFIVNAYLEVVTLAVRRHGGTVGSIAGDGVMSFFGATGQAGDGARAALAAAAEIWEGIERLAADLEAGLAAPLRFGMGLHSGRAVVGSIGPQDARAAQFLGDTGNVAARLDGLAKEHGAPLVVSRAALSLAGVARATGDFEEVALRGRDRPLSVAVVRNRDELVALVPGLAEGPVQPASDTHRKPMWRWPRSGAREKPSRKTAVSRDGAVS